MSNQCTWFPLTKFCYINAKNRCTEPTDLEEVNDCFGPKDRDCIDCYYPITPLCFIIDIATLNLFQCKKFRV